MTRTAIYHATPGHIVEQPAMEKPKKRVGQYRHGSREYYQAIKEWHLYNEHKDKCRTIPCSPECRGLWKEGQVLEEDVDYVVGAYPIKAMMSTDPKYMAFPLPVKSEMPIAHMGAGDIRESEEDFLESIDSMDDASRIFVDKSMAIGNRIVEVMEMRGLKQKDLAQRMDKTEAEVSRMLGGMHNLTLRMIAKIEAALDHDIICIPEAK